MSAPEGYSELAIIGTSYKGEYAEMTEYHKMNTVYYEGSTYVALKDNPSGPPTNDDENWHLHARGFDNHVFEQDGEVDEES